MLAVEFVSEPALRAFAARPMGSLAVVALFAAAIGLPLETYGAFQIILLAAAFFLIAAGADLFGLLTAPVSKALGDASYSIYFLHGIVLFCMFDALRTTGADLSKPILWALLPIGLVAVSALSVITYRWIEKPFIDQRRPEAGTLTTSEVAP